MNNQKTIRQRIEQLFELPIMKMPWSLYMAQLNESGKLTARSIMDILTVVLEAVEGMEGNIEDAKLVSDNISSEKEAKKVTEVEIIEEATPEKISQITAETVTKSAPEDIFGTKPLEHKSSE